MRYWKPVPSPFRFIPLLLLALSLLLLFPLWNKLTERIARVDYDLAVYGLGLAHFLLLYLAVLLIFLARDASTIRYSLGERELRIAHGGVRHTIPLAGITGVLAPGDMVGGRSVAVRLRGAALPGYVVGEGRSAQIGRVLSVATMPPPAQVFVRTPALAYGISPQDTAGFLSALKERRDALDELDPEVQAAAPTTTRRGISRWGYTLWADRPARYLLLAGLALNALCFGYVALVYSDLPSLLPLHWNAQAQVDRIGTPYELLHLPAFALGIWLVNTVAGWWALRRERAVTLFLLGGAVAAQVVFWVGALSITLRAL